MRSGAALLLASVLALFAMAPTGARAVLPQPPEYSGAPGNCTVCHADPLTPFPAQLNGGGTHLTGGTVIQHAINANMTGLGAGVPALTNAQLDTIAAYIQSFITSPEPTLNVTFNFGGGTSTTLTLPDITINSPFGALTGLATNSNTNGTVSGYNISPAQAIFVPTACATGAGSFSYHGTGPATSSVRTQAVNILNPATPPVISPGTGALTAGQTGVPYSTSITAAQCNSIVTYSISAGSLPAGLGISAGGVISGTPTAVGNPSFTVHAVYPGGQFTNTVYSINVTLGAPVVTSAATAANSAEGVAYAGYTITATNTPTSYSGSGLPPGLSVVAGTGAVTGTPTSAAGSPYSATLTATNATGPGNKIVVFNVAPALNSSTTANGQTGVLFSYSLTKTAGPAFTSYAALDPLPAGLTLNTGTGVVSGTPTTIQSLPVRFTGTTGVGATSAQYTVTFTITLGPPVITSLLTANGGEAIVFTNYQITATNAPLTSYNAVGLPSGLSINTGTGVISGTPASGTAATSPYNVTISATNATGTGSAILVISIAQFQPVINSALTKTGFTGVALSYQITATNGPTLFGATALPPGLSINTGTGLITGTPTVVANTPGTISAGNGAGTDTQPFTWNIQLGPPVITSPTTAGGAVGFAFTYQIVATNSPTSFGASGLPPGLTINAAGLISGTPTVNGVYGATVSATNSNTTTSQGVTITIAVGIPVISSAATASGTAGTPFSYQITASNGPTSFGATGLPLGLSINATTGNITGTPTVNGTFPVNLSATNGTGTGTKPLTLVIGLAPPVITSPSSVTTKTGDNFHYELKALVGSPTYTATGLPGGLALDPVSGFITGIVTASGGTFDVAIVATNAAGSTNFVLHITVGFVVATAGDAKVDVPFETPTPIVLPVQGDITTLTIVSLPNHGLVTTQANSGTVTYTPASNYSGPDTFTYTVTNPAGVSKLATVQITVGTSAPVAGGGTVIVDLNTAKAIDMAKFAHGSALTGVAIKTQPAHGTVAVNGMTITYTPRNNYFGPDAFSYVAFGNAGSSPPATIKIEVVGRPDPTADPEVLGIVDAQSQAARRFAGTQIGNYQRRMESLHNSPQAAAQAPEAAAVPPAPAPAPRAGAPERVQLAFADAPTKNDGGILPTSLVSTLMSLATTRSLDLGVAAPDGGGGGAATPKFAGESSFWIAGNANFGNFDATSNRSSLRFSTDGISAGMDRRMSQQLTLGAGAGYAQDDTDVGRNSRVKAKGGSVAMYGSYAPSPRTYIDMLLGYGQIKFDTRRFIEPLDDFATASRNGKQVFGSVAFGYEHRDGNLMVSPYGRVDYAYDRFDQVTESAPGAYALTFNDSNQRSVQAAAGVRVESKHETDFGFASPRARIEYRRELEGERSIAVRYADLLNGPLYTVTPTGISRNSLLLGVGTDLVFRSGLRLGFDYTAQKASGASNVQGVRLLLTQDLDRLTPANWRWEPLTFKYSVNVDGGVSWDSNVSRGREADEKLSDNIFSLGLNSSRSFSLNEHTRLVLTALGSAEKFERHQGLGRFSGGAQGEVQYRSSGAFDATTFGFVGRAFYDQYESSLRTGPRYFAGVNARRALTDRIDLFVEAGASARNGRSDVFTWRDWSLKGNLDWSLGRNGLVYLTGEYRSGDTVSSGRASLVNLSLAEVFTADDAFEDQGLFAYRFDAHTLIGTMGYNFPLGPRDSIDFSWRRAQSTPTRKPDFDFSGALKYIDNQYSIVYLLRF